MRPVLVAAIALCVGLVGCDKPDPQEQPSQYDKSIDGRIPLSPVSAEDRLLTGDLDSADVGEDLAVEPPVTATGDAEADTKAVIKAIAESVKAGNVTGLADHVVAEQAEALRPLLTEVSKVVEGLIRLNESANRTLGKGLAELAAGAMPGGAPMPIPMSADSAGEMDIDQALELVKFQAVSETEVGLLRPDGEPTGVTFRKVEGRWRIQLPADAVSKIQEAMKADVVDKVVDAVCEVLDELTTGVDGGTVTEENFAEKVGTLLSEKIQPLLGELMILVGPMMEGVGGGPGGSPSPE